MFPNRIRLPQDVTEVLKQMKGRTGVTPNILCRIALVMSLNDGARPDVAALDVQGLEFNSYTLFGPHALVYYSFIRQLYGQLEDGRLEELVSFHIYDGLKRLRTVRSIADLIDVSATPYSANGLSDQGVMLSVAST